VKCFTGYDPLNRLASSLMQNCLLTKKNARALKLLEKNVIYTGERYETPLLWATNHPDLPNNFAVASARF
jgi:hypothetical protein